MQFKTGAKIPNFPQIAVKAASFYSILNFSKLLISLPAQTFNYMQTKKCPTLEEFKIILKKHSLKATPQRLAVHEAMIVLGHASADMVTEEILSQGKAKVTVASVYNILTQLALLGIYHHRLSSNNKMYFDVNTFYHVHFYDKENHTFKDVMDEDLAAMIHSLLGRKRFEGYKVESIDIQIIGRPNKKRYMA